MGTLNQCYTDIYIRTNWVFFLQIFKCMFALCFPKFLTKDNQMIIRTVNSSKIMNNGNFV